MKLSKLFAFRNLEEPKVKFYSSTVLIYFFLGEQGTAGPSEYFFASFDLFAKSPTHSLFMLIHTNNKVQYFTSEEFFTL